MGKKQTKKESVKVLDLSLKNALIEQSERAERLKKQCEGMDFEEKRAFAFEMGFSYVPEKPLKKEQKKVVKKGQ